ncbi:MAG: guanine deaminase [Opitutaceae bacterium]|nr:guanine deaminase [Opitutaceae bacterium]
MPSNPGSHEIRAIRGAWLNPVSDESCEYFPNGILLVQKRNGWWKIKELGTAKELIEKHRLEEYRIENEAGLLMPPFFDMHFHWVQDEVREMPKTSLLEWLVKYTFPKEEEFSDPDFAEEKAQCFWQRILSTGTIGGLCYSSIHKTAFEAAMRHAGDYFKVGNVLMTMNSPRALKQSKDEAIELNRWASEGYGRFHVGSPRFAPTTAPEVIAASAGEAKSFGGFLQTHMCETHQEIEWVKSIYRELPGFEDIETYIEIYERTGFLGPKTVLGHCIHLTDAEWKLMAETDTVVASCPTSNGPLDERGLGSGLFDFRRADQEGVRWVLATDIGGGPYLSMLDVMASFVRQNRAQGIEGATHVQALYRSTLAGAKILGIDSKGSFAEDNDVDYVAVKMDRESLDASDAEVVLGKCLSKTLDNRESYESAILKTVLEGKTVFSC